MNTETIADPAAAERASLNSTISRLSGDLATYGRARSVVEAKIAHLQATELGPIVTAIEGFEREKAEASTRLAILDFSALAPRAGDGERLFGNEVQQLRLTLSAVQRSPASTDVKRQVELVADGLLREIAATKLPGDPAHMSGGEVAAFWLRTHATYLPRVKEAQKRIREITGAAPTGNPGEPPVPILTGGNLDMALQARG